MDAFAFEQLAPAAPTVHGVSATVDDATIEALRAAIRAESAAEVAALRAEAREQGRLEGLESARQELEPAGRALAEALGEVAEERLRSSERLEREAVELAIQIAEKVLGGALEVQPERILEVVRGALRRMVDSERVIVLVSPEDLPLVRDAAGSQSGMETIEVREERRVARGGCILRTADGEIDARIGEQLQRARELIEAELRS